MRLLNTNSLELHEFFHAEAPPYAILSHRWANGEVTFKDVSKKRSYEAAGWKKIRECCQFALKRKKKWLWIDTCCIDKRSSAELSEAINSMFTWYQNAEECYAYLNDVGCEVDDVEAAGVAHNSSAPHLSNAVQLSLYGSQWFTRGWTLQELLAPKQLYFVDKNWKGILGSKLTLHALITDVTGIDEETLLDNKIGPHQSIAKRMSWVSQRVCTRHEDIAYCLMGIFGVNMPLLYGEGGNAAFRRLQLEILKDSNDESIFAWKQGEARPGFGHADGSMLAKSPSAFVNLSDIKHFQSHEWEPRPPYAITNRGLAFPTILSEPMVLRGRSEAADAHLIPLRCYREGLPGSSKIPLAIAVIEKGPQFYYRISWWPTGERLPTCPANLYAKSYGPRMKFVGKEQLIYIASSW